METDYMTDSGTPAATIDFSVCEAERIDAPGAIQGFGMMFVLERDTLRLSHVSRNGAEFLGGAPETAIGKEAAALTEALGLHVDLQAICRRIDDGDAAVGAQPVEIAHDDQASYLLSLGPRHFLLERRPEPQMTPSSGDVDLWLGTLRARFAAMSGNIFATAQLATDMVRSLTDFDRVMLYRFAADATGEVVAESRVQEIVPYLGLRYPATDIPSQARRLYLENRIREIVDTQAFTEPLHPSCAANDPDPVDLSTSVLRAISPYHLQYTSNMGVRATLVASVIVDGKLWGLLACHHRLPKLVPCAHRKAVLAAVEALAASIALSQRDEARRLTERVGDALAGIGDMLSTSGNSAHVLLETVIVGTRSDGAMLCSGSQVIAAGRTPPADLLTHIGQKLAETAADGIIVTNNLRQSLGTPDISLNGLAGAAGLVAASAPLLMLVAFREEFIHSVNWGGDPRQAADIDPRSGRLAPRESFDSWRETVTGTSRPWEGHATDFLAGLRAMRVLPRIADRLSTDMRALRDDLANRTALRAAVMNVTLDGMTLAVAADMDGITQIVSGNRAFLKLFDLQPEECRFLQLTELFERLGVREPPESLPEDADLVVWSPIQGPRNILLQRRSVLDTLIDGLRQNWDIYIFQDVTERRRREEALAAAFENALSEVRAKAEFLANMSHELRTPLNAVLGFSEVIAGSMFGPHSNAKYEEYGQNIHGAGAHLLELIDRLLTASQIEARKRVLSESTFDLAAIVSDCATWISEQPGDDKPAISVLKPVGPVHVFADELAIRQVAINLIGNAVKFTPPHGKVLVTVKADDMGAPELTVLDNGPGIAPDLLAQLFQPFRQGEGAYAKRHGGVGLGLSIVKGLVQLHGGLVRLRSDQAAGTEAIVLLPVMRRR
jgi:light-regulated signal transduction histidine kinase (bacteriophytochrome)